jgi:hypothetical protein
VSRRALLDRVDWLLSLRLEISYSNRYIFYIRKSTILRRGSEIRIRKYYYKRGDHGLLMLQFFLGGAEENRTVYRGQGFDPS